MTSQNSQTPLSRVALPVLVFVGTTALVTASAWLTPDWKLRQQLTGWQFWMLELQLALFVAGAIYQCRSLATAVSASRMTWAQVLAASMLAFVLAGWVAPRTSRIFFDEQIYQGIARSLADTHRAEMCSDGVVEYGLLQCSAGDYNKQPPGYSHLLSVAYRLVGVRPVVAHVLNNWLAAMSVVVVFLLTALAFQDERGAMWASLIMAVIPMQLTWSNTAAAEPSAALACAVAVLAAFQFVRTRTTSALVWCAIAVVFAASFRPECLLVVAVVFAVIVLLAPAEIRQPRFWWTASAGMLLGWNVIAHHLAVWNNPWGAPGDRFALEFVGHNVLTNGWFYFADGRFPALFGVLALLGLFLSGRNKVVLIPVGYFAAFWGIFLFFYAGSYDYGADVRYSLMTYTPLAVLAGVGAAHVARSLERWGVRSAGLAAMSVVLFQASTYLPLIRAVGEEAWGARADVRFMSRIARSIPNNALVFTQTPTAFHIDGVSAAQMSMLKEGQRNLERDRQRFAGGLFLHWGFWCNAADPVQVTICRAALEQFDSEIVFEETERDYRFVLYRLQPR